MKRWPTKPLAEAYWFQEGPGVRKWQFRNSGIKLLNVSNITKEGVLDLSKTGRHLSEEEVTEKYSHFLAAAGDLVIASSGISFDDDGLLRTRGAFVESHHLPLCLNTSTIRFKPKEGVSSLAWLRYWLASREFRQQITRLVTGSAQQNFGPSHLKATQITLPSLPEQERLVKLLDEADELRKLRSQADHRTTAFIPALYNEMFGDPLTNSQGWPTVLLREVAEVKAGAGFPLDKQGLVDQSLPFFKVGDMNTPGNESEMHSFQHSISEKTRKELGAPLFPAGTLIFPKVGAAIATNKKRILIRPSCVDNNVMAICPGERLATPFLSALFAAKDLSDFASNSNPPSIRKTTVENWQIPIPPLPLQNEFAKHVTEVRQFQATQAAGRRRSEDLFQAMLHRAFNGDL